MKDGARHLGAGELVEQHGGSDAQHVHQYADGRSAEKEDDAIRKRTLDDKDVSRGDGKKGHEHAQAAAGLNHADFQVVDDDDIAASDGRNAKRLQDIGAGQGCRPPHRASQHHVELPRPGKDEQQEDAGRPAPAQHGRPGNKQDQSGQAREQRAGLEPLEGVGGPSQAHQAAGQDEDDAPPTGPDAGVRKGIAAEPQNDEGQERYDVTVRVLRVLRPATDHLLDRRPVYPANNEEQPGRQPDGGTMRFSRMGTSLHDAFRLSFRTRLIHVLAKAVALSWGGTFLNLPIARGPSASWETCHHDRITRPAHSIAISGPAHTPLPDFHPFFRPIPPLISTIPVGRPAEVRSSPAETAGWIAGAKPRMGGLSRRPGRTREASGKGRPRPGPTGLRRTRPRFLA